MANAMLKDCVGILESACPLTHRLRASSDIGPFGVTCMSVIIPGETLEGKKEKGGSKTGSRDNHLDRSPLEPYLEEIRPVGCPEDIFPWVLSTRARGTPSSKQNSTAGKLIDSRVSFPEFFTHSVTWDTVFKVYGPQIPHF